MNLFTKFSGLNLYNSCASSVAIDKLLQYYWEYCTTALSLQQVKNGLIPHLFGRQRALCKTDLFLHIKLFVIVLMKSKDWSNKTVTRGILCSLLEFPPPQLRLNQKLKSVDTSTVTHTKYKYIYNTKKQLF